MCRTHPTPRLGVTSCCLLSTFCSPSCDTVTIHCKVSFLLECHLMSVRARLGLSHSLFCLSCIFGSWMVLMKYLLREWMDGYPKVVIVSFDARHSCLFLETYFIQGLPIPQAFNKNLGFSLSPCSYEVLGKHFIPKFLYLLKMVIP